MNASVNHWTRGMSVTYVKRVKKFDVQKLINTYGPIALGIYLAIFVMTLGAFFVAIKAGFQVEGTAENAGTLFAAWVATKVTQPLRILATVVLTPLVARLSKRRVGGEPPQAT